MLMTTIALILIQTSGEQITETYHGECTEEDELQMDQTRNLAVRASQEEDK